MPDQNTRSVRRWPMCKRAASRDSPEVHQRFLDRALAACPTEFRVRLTVAWKVQEIDIHTPSGELSSQVNHDRLTGREPVDEKHRGVKGILKSVGSRSARPHPDHQDGGLILSRDMRTD